MEENKGIFTKIKEIIIKFFNKPKALPTPSQEKEYISIENNDFKKQYNVRKDIEQADTKESKISEWTNNYYESIINDGNNRLFEQGEGEPPIEALIRMVGNTNIPEQAIIDIINEISEFSFLKSLEGCSFHTNTIIDNDSPKNSYACYLAQDGEIKEEKKLPICSVGNKEQAENIEETLNSLKNITDENKIKEVIEDIINNGFKLNDTNKRFKPNDFNLTILLQKLLNERSDEITIGADYLYEKNTKGLSVIKSARKIYNDEQSRKKEEELKRIDYKSIIMNSILENKEIDTSNMSEEQKAILQQCYINMMQEIEKSAEYFELALKCISKHPEYSKYLRNYIDIQKDYEKYKNNSVKILDITRQRNNTIRDILNSLKEILKKDLNKIIGKEDIEK